MMGKKALFFGAIGVLAETSEMQRKAFNRAFVSAGLDWYWDPATYYPMLQTSGGRQRIAAFAESLGQEVDAAAVHDLKTKHFARMMAADGIALRPGIRTLLDAAKAQGQLVGFVTSTGVGQANCVLDALAPHLRRGELNYIGSRERVQHAKPAPDIYLDALEFLEVAPEDAIAIEDSPSSTQAAIAAGIATYALPGAPHVNDQFPDGVIVLDRLEPSLLQPSSLAAE